MTRTSRKRSVGSPVQLAVAKQRVSPLTEVVRHIQELEERQWVAWLEKELAKPEPQRPVLPEKPIETLAEANRLLDEAVDTHIRAIEARQCLRSTKRADDLRLIELRARLNILARRFELRHVAHRCKRSGRRGNDDSAADAIAQITTYIKDTGWKPSGKHVQGETKRLLEDVQTAFLANGKGELATYNRVRSALRKLRLKK